MKKGQHQTPEPKVPLLTRGSLEAAADQGPWRLPLTRVPRPSCTFPRSPCSSARARTGREGEGHKGNASGAAGRVKAQPGGQRAGSEPTTPTKTLGL